jgi:hypothetical protein
VLRYVVPSAGVAHTKNNVALTGSGFGAPAFVFFGEQLAPISAQEPTWMTCVTPEMPPGMLLRFLPLALLFFCY